MQKDKRTKDQILRLLDRALEQEEKLSGKITALEMELQACKKQLENPMQEFAEEALASSKTSFRIDYYRTSAKGPLKGIIEHLPSRTNKSFSGDGMRIVSKFMGKYIPELRHATTIQTAKTDFSTVPETPQKHDEAMPEVSRPRLLDRLREEQRLVEKAW